MAEPTLLIDKTIKSIEFIYRYMGINIKVEKKTRMDTYRCWLTYFINFTWLNTDAGGAILWFCIGVAQRKAFTELTYASPCMTLSCLSNTKTFFVITKEKNIDAMIDLIRKLEIDQRSRDENVETKKIISDDSNSLNRILRVLKIIYIALVVCFALSPISLVFIHYWMTNEVELMLPFLITYPFDPFDMRYYPWVYLHQIWSDILTISGICAADFMFYIFCSFLCTQFRLLQHYIEIFIPSELLNDQDKNEVRLKLVELIQWHQQLFSSAKVLEELYTASTLFNFVASSALICLTGFNVMVIDDIAFQLSFFFFLLMSLLQIFFFCYFGDLLMESSMGVGDAVYNSNWYLADKDLAKSLLIILTRSQTPCVLTACNFAEVSLKAFMKICSTAWSYFALLQTLYSGPE